MKYLNRLLPLLVLLFTALLLMLLCYSGKKHNDEMLKRHVLSLLEGSRVRLTETIKTRVLAIEALSEHLQGHLWKGDPIEEMREMFIMISDPVYRTFEGFQSINWVNRDGTIEWTYPLKGEYLVEAMAGDYSQEAIRKAEKYRSFSITPVIETAGNKPVVAVYYPVVDRKGQIKGYVDGVFEIKSLIDASVTDRLDVDFMVMQDGKVLFSSFSEPVEDGWSVNSNSSLINSSMAEDVVGISGLSLTLRMWPTERLIRLYRVTHRWQWPILIGLPFMALALSYAVYILQRHYAELKTKDRALRESEIKFRSLVEHSLAGVYLIQDGLFRYVNPRFCEVFGYNSPEEIIDKKGPLDLTRSSDWPVVEEIPGRRPDGHEGEVESINYVLKAVKANGEVFDIEVYGANTLFNGRPAVIGMLLDIADKKRLEEQLRQSQRLESIGLLAGGIAHDFNNILMAITGYASLLNMKLKDGVLRNHVDQILKASDRAANLTHGLLAFSRRQLLQPQPVYFGKIIRDFEKILRRVIPENIEFVIDLKDTRAVMVDQGQIEQVIINLATNARDAMSEGGKLIIETFEVAFDEAYIEKHSWVNKGGGFVCLSISDTGDGMAPAVKEHIFEPFFTTKGIGKGTGLGLSTVYGIIKQHNGFIHVYSEKGRGTTFKVYLPVTESEPLDVSHVSESPISGGSETILLAEDEDNVRETIKEALEEYGYTVFVARDGEEAMTLIHEKSGEIDLMILDVVMPKEGGKEVYEKAKGVGFRGKVIFISGYTINTIQNFILEEAINFLTKPFRPVTLVRKVREVLDSYEK
ncbi:MAG: response regulator [Nitrospirae bacterium]|nr:response regulator [Nitrospirota bacterium]